MRVVPAARGNAWEEVADLSAALGLVLDPWQEQALEAAMGERADGRWAALQVGLSVPRQNGKSALVIARALAGVLLLGEQSVIISAHQADTYRESTWLDLTNLIESSPALSRRIKPGGVMSAINRESVKFSNGGRIKFKARTGTGGRGFSCDSLLLDEGQIVDQQAWATIFSTMSARENPQIWLTGTPPTPEDDPYAFEALRRSALSGKSTSLAWVEWSADVADDPSLVSTWAKANPAWHTRINHDVVREEFNTYPPERFALERLGIWASEGRQGVIDLTKWESCRADLEPVRSPVVLVVETSPDRRATTLVAVGSTAAGLPQVEVLPPLAGGPSEAGAGTSWVAARVAQIVTDSPDVGNVVVDSKGAAASLVPSIQDELDRVQSTVQIVEVDGPTYVDACGWTFDAIQDGRLRHGGGPVLTAAVKAAQKRERDAVWVWDRRRMGATGSPLVAMTLGLGVWAGLEAYDPMMSVL